MLIDIEGGCREMNNRCYRLCELRVLDTTTPRMSSEGVAPVRVRSGLRVVKG